jgi:hypothetical protein
MGHDLYNEITTNVLKLAGGTISGDGGELYNRGTADWTNTLLISLKSQKRIHVDHQWGN